MHTAVLVQEVIKYLDPHPGENFIDCTLGAGGHASAILERNAPQGKFLGIDADSEGLKETQARMQDELQPAERKRIQFVPNNFTHVKEIVQEVKFPPVHGILFDLGLSSDQLEKRKRGFSFQRSEPLDMRYDLENPLLAEKIINYWSRQQIAKVLIEYGEEHFANDIAKAIIETRRAKPIRTTSQLVAIIEKATPKIYHRGRIHPATKTFQALRIAVNNELENIREGLSQATDILEPNGRLVVLSFHSLEDRIVKNFLRDTEILTPLTKKPIIPSAEEIKTNPRARSAKLRAALKKTFSNFQDSKV